ncbi:DUF58 domain-containing protein [Demequina zhanjiangensis]|uniref:DUF58 domain-containing protein n=1 Tax=Demequina zhanjiangensis TaxID=3051659 RepID=A0ABT8G3F1_9MICO|nr:DUF58 domain-containing protein [Demequina sp. SYSU T00b26]MDN4473660.1 DUF58 domain-containing protein [Demequina sp. SYSU T00b26]
MSRRGTATAATAPASTRPGRTETVVTARGIGMTGGGLALTALGIGLASTLIVMLGIATLATAAVAALWLLSSVQLLRRRYRTARRVISPFPLVAGEAGTVHVEVASSHGSTRVPQLDIREQAAAELTGMRPTSASVTRRPGSVLLSYSLSPTSRGRWPLGPAVVRAADPLGLAWADTPVGAEELVPVRPRVVDLTAAGGSRLDGLEQISRGARRASADDAAVREYRHGDDPRRVHWPSSARRGSLVVRADEHAGRPPADLLADLPSPGEDLETVVAAAASLSLAVLADGHAVRIVAPGTRPLNRWAAEARDEARAGLLDDCIDLQPAHGSPSDALVDAAHALMSEPGSGSLLVALVEPRGEADAGVRMLAGLGAAGHAVALVREAPRAAETAHALERGGWRCARWKDLEDLPEAWAAVAKATERA